MCRLSAAVPSATRCAFFDRSARVLDRDVTADGYQQLPPLDSGVCAGRRSEDVTERAFVARASAAFLAKSLSV